MIGWEGWALRPCSSCLFWPAPLSVSDPTIIPTVGTRRYAEPHHPASEPSLSPLNSNASPHAEKEKVQRNSKQVVRGQRCCAIGTAVPLLAARAELWEGPGSRYDDLLYRGPQNIPSYQNDLNIGAWEGKHSPSIILKINPPLYSSPESINNVARGGNLQQRFILILWLLFISL